MAEHWKAFRYNDRIDLPERFSIHNIQGKFLIIAKDQATAACFDAREYDVFRLFQQNKTIGEVYKNLTRIYSTDEARTILANTLVEIDAKGFYRNVNVKKYKSKGLMMQIFMTHACNLRCVHCYVFAGERLKNELSFKQWSKVIRDFKDIGGEHLTISGGEPLCRKDCIDLIKYSRTLDLEVVLLTNGTLITNEDIAATLASLLSDIQISLDGPSVYSNDVIRGKGVYEKVLKAIRYFKGKDIKITLAMTILPQTVEAYEKECTLFLKELMDEFGDQVVIRFSSDVLEGREIGCPSDEEEKRLSKTAIRIQSEISKENFNYLVAESTFKPSLQIRNCGFGDGISVDPNGDVFGCNKRFPIVGNVLKENLRDIWAKLKELSNDTDIDNFEQCKNCDIKYFCGGGCRIRNYQKKGKYTINESCTEEKKKRFYEFLVEQSKYLYLR